MLPVIQQNNLNHTRWQIILRISFKKTQGLTLADDLRLLKCRRIQKCYVLREKYFGIKLNFMEQTSVKF